MSGREPGSRLEASATVTTRPPVMPGAPSGVLVSAERRSGRARWRLGQATLGRRAPRLPSHAERALGADGRELTGLRTELVDHGLHPGLDVAHDRLDALLDLRHDGLDPVADLAGQRLDAGAGLTGGRLELGLGLLDTGLRLLGAEHADADREVRGVLSALLHVLGDSGMVAPELAVGDGGRAVSAHQSTPCV